MKEVYFASNRQAAINAARQNKIVIYAVDVGTWDDFGHNFMVEFVTIADNGKDIQERIFLMLEGGGRTGDRIRSEASRGGSLVPSDNFSFSFVSLLPDAHVYKRIIREAGLSDALDILGALHDATIIARVSDFPKERALLETQEFWYGALRSNETFNAYRRANQYYIPHSHEYVEDAASSFLFSERLVSCDNTMDIFFDFSDDPLKRNRLSVVIGENGSGKTQVLNKIVQTLSDTDQQPQKTPACNKLIVFSAVASDLYPHHLPVEAKIDYQYMSLVRLIAGEADPTTAAIIDCVRDDNRVSFEFANKTFADRYSFMTFLLGEIGFGENIFVPLKEGGEPISGQERVWKATRYHPMHKRINEQRQLQLYRQIDYTKSLVLDFRHLGRALRQSLSLFLVTPQSAITTKQFCKSGWTACQLE